MSNEVWHHKVLYKGLVSTLHCFLKSFCFLLLFFNFTWPLQKFQVTKHKNLAHSVAVDDVHLKTFLQCASRKTVLFGIIFNKKNTDFFLVCAKRIVNSKIGNIAYPDDHTGLILEYKRICVV